MASQTSGSDSSLSGRADSENEIEKKEGDASLRTSGEKIMDIAIVMFQEGDCFLAKK